MTITTYWLKRVLFLFISSQKQNAHAREHFGVSREYYHFSTLIFYLYIVYETASCQFNSVSDSEVFRVFNQFTNLLSISNNYTSLDHYKHPNLFYAHPKYNWRLLMFIVACGVFISRFLINFVIVSNDNI